MNSDFNKTKEQLMAELDELRIQSKKREKELEAANRKLTVNNQQLIACKKSLGASEEKYRNLTEHISEVIFLTDDKGKIKYISPVSSNIFGYTPQEMEGQFFMKYLKKTEIPKAIKKFLKTISTGSPTLNIELVMKRKNGKAFSAELTGKRYKTGNFKGTIGTIRDITERKQTEKEILQQQYLLKKAQEIGSIGTWELDIMNNNLIWTEETYKIFGLPAGAKMNLEIFFSFIHPDDSDYVNEKWAAALNHENYDIEHRILVDSKTKWVREKAYLEFNDKGDALKAIGFVQDITERKQAVEALKASEEKYRSLIENMNDLVYRYEILPEPKFTYVSPNSTGFIGYSPEEHYADPMLGMKIIHPEDQHILKEYMAGPVDKKKSIVFRWKTKDNKIIWTEQRNSPVYDKNGNLIALEGIARDITEKVNAERKLKASEAKFRSYIDMAPDGVFIANEKGKYVEVNKAACKITGYSEEELLHFTIADLIQDEYLEKAKTHFQTLSKEGFASSDVGFITKSGEKRFWRVDGVKLSETRYLGFVQDITEHKQAEEELRLKAKLLNSVGQAVIATNPEGLIKYLNPAAAKLYGWTAEEAIGKNIMEVTVPEMSAQEATGIMETLSRGESWSGEFNVRNKAGIQFPAFVNDVPVFNKDGEMEYIIGLSVDITERKKAEEKLKESEAKFKAAFQTSPDAVNINKLNGEYVEINEGFTRLTGFTEKDVIGKPSSEIAIWSVPTDREKLVAGLQKNGIVENLESLFRAKDGTLIPALMSAKIINLKGEPHILSVTRAIVDRKKMEQELKTAKEKAEASEERFNLAMQASNDGIFDWNLETNEIYYSPAWKKMIGYEDHELPNDFSVWKNTTDPADVKKSWELQRKVITKQIDRFVMEFKMKHKDGHWVDILSRAEAIFNNSGKAVRFVGTHTDITERKQAEDEIRLHSEIMKNLSEGVYLIGLDDGLIKYANPKFEKMFGYNEGEMIGKEVSIVNAPTEKAPEETKHEIIDILKKTGEWQGEVNNIKKDGIHFWCYANVSLHDHPIYGRVIISVHTDITERKQAEEKLRNLSEMQSIILRMASGYINMPQELVEDSINNSLKELGEFVQADRAYIFDYDWTRNVCKNTYEWCNEGINPEIDNLQNVPNEVIDYWVEAHKNGREMNIEDVMQLPPDDGLRQVLEPQGVKSVLAIPMMKPDECIGFIGFDSVRKIHKYSEKEKILLKIFSDMIVNIGNRIELEKNLVQAKEKAEESDRLKSAFLTNMSHEIRTPMNGILGFTDLLKEPQLTGEQKDKYIRVIEKSGARMLNTINDIIDISRIEAGQIKVEKTEVTVNEILEEQYNFFYHQAKSKGLELIYKPTLSDAETHIVTDKHKLEGILTNLIKNAIKYTDQGKITMACSRKKEQAVEVLEFYVKDTGIGIPPNRIDAVFNRFEQADIEDTRAFEGSGLGLAIAKSYVEMLGGKISVSSKEGSGSAFTFSIPYTKQFVKENDANENIDKELQSSLSNLSVIIAEDDEVSISLFKTVFKNTFQKISYTGTGKETINLLLENPDTDLILMDIKMPDINGYDATREIRKFNRDVVIIAQTAFGLSGDREKAIEAGCNDYIAKPIKKDELYAMIQKCFGE